MDFQQRGHGPPSCSSMELALPRTFGARPPMRQTVTRTRRRLRMHPWLTVETSACIAKNLCQHTGT